MSATPPVPQRPTRSQDAQPPQAPADAPKVPPRPTRAVERSISRDREAATRSPLNDSPFAPKLNLDSPQPSADPASNGLQKRPSVASLPLIGQEGMEYASLDEPAPAAKIAAPTHGAPPQQVSNVAHDLPLHAPTASDAPQASLSKISTITSHSKTKDGEHSPASASAHGKSRPPSIIHTPHHERSQSRNSHHYQSEDEHGIPSFGTTVPMYPNAGDVQAPGLAHGSHPPASGVGFFHSGSSRPPTSDGRRKSAQGFHGPPGSYGLHGHGALPHDKFEKDWYARHPEEVAKEEHALHVPAGYIEKHEYAMSSEELNNLVHETSRPASGMGVHGEAMGIPSEAYGFQASADYAKPAAPAPLEKVKSRTRAPSVGHADSPLRQAFSANEVDQQPTIHVSEPKTRIDKIGGAGYDPPLEDLGPQGGNTKQKGGWIVERGSGTPILASDEVAKHPSSEFMQPAVSPAQMLSEDDYFSAHESDHGARGTKSRSRSRPNSRHGSLDLSRLTSHDLHYEGAHTPLEDIEEYEPLFEDDDAVTKKPANASVERIRLDKRRFPSQDIWEDTPTSLQLETTVEEAEEAKAAFESPEKEQARKGEPIEADRAAVAETAAKAKPKFGSHLKEDQRPGVRRFPSQDVWEDTPDSLRLETTVDNEEEQAAAEQISPPTVPARPVRAKPDLATKAEPVVPPRPQRAGERAPPAVSSKPKPQIPARPNRSPNRDLSPEEAVKAKPAVPARPAGGPSKFASIRAGFLSDLNSRIGLGPQAPAKAPEEETPETAEPAEEEDKTPLGDARRGRARGPARRKPAASPTAPAGACGIAEPWTVWSISGTSPRGIDLAISKRPQPAASAATKALKMSDIDEQPMVSPLARNTAGEALLDKSSDPDTSSGALAHPPSASMDARAHRESETRREALRQFEAERIGHVGDVPEVVPEPYEEIQRASSTMPSHSAAATTTSAAAEDGKSPAKEKVVAAPAAAETASKGQMPGKASIVAQAPMSPIATQKNPMEVLVDDETARRASESEGAGAAAEGSATRHEGAD